MEDNYVMQSTTHTQNFMGNWKPTKEEFHRRMHSNIVNSELLHGAIIKKNKAQVFRSYRHSYRKF